MFTWHPLVIQQRIQHIKERITDLDTQIELAQIQEETADDMARYYEEERENAQDYLDLLRNAVMAATDFSEMLNNIQPTEDVGSDIQNALYKSGIRYSCGKIAVAGVEKGVADNPVLANWKINLDTRVERKTAQLAFFKDLQESSEPDIEVMQLEVNDFVANRDEANNQEDFHDRAHTELSNRQDVLKSELAEMEIQFITALNRKRDV